MKRTLACFLLTAALSCVLSPVVRAQTTNGSMLFTPNVDLSSGTQNSYVGYVGGVFLTSYDYYPDVNYLGYYDKGGDGLANSHTVSLWDASAGNSLLVTATVPAGTSAPLVDGYRWVALPSTVHLTYNNWYVIDAQVDNVDTWGDLITDNSGAGQVTWSGQYANLAGGYEFSRAGRYDSVEPPSNQSGSDAIYPAANLGYNVVPEPTALAVLGLGGLAFGVAARRRR
ncbi:MAG TPA: PEP-CTERM sorting domain-containing protein [Dongiaceae bacterium]|nr:PEP-CTERM sorting domain-containing protein [Dongiaceae bacterium]